MKQIKWITGLFIVLSFAVTGCLKDEGFENHEYGINDPDVSPAGIGFTLGVKYLNSTGLYLSDLPQDVDTDVVLISLLSSSPATTDIHVHVEVDQALVTDYNTHHGTNMIDFDPSLYHIANPDVVIPAGSFHAPIVITVPLTSNLNPNNTYGLGLKITGADGGYMVASNENKIVLSIAIKNQYDGEYTSNGYFYHPSVPRPMNNIPKTLATLNATDVTCDLGDFHGAPYVAIFSVDPATNHVTVSAYPTSAAAPYFQWDTDLATGNPDYTPMWPRSAECNNVYDPVAQEFRMRYGYLGSGGYRVSEEVIKRN
jgi:hypothetical protein